MTGIEQRPGRYFLLSYAHSPPLTGQRPGDLDQWVRRFFDDLSRSVAERASAGSGLRPGFFDQLIPLGSNWMTALTGALETAEVFVPLYSPAYFSRTQSGREWECFHRRMLRAGITDPASRFVPVLWTPLQGGQHRSWAQDVPTFDAVAPAYGDNGLQALVRLKVYEDAYRTVVGKLADRIVTIAESDPVGPSAADGLEGLESPFRPEAAAAQFAVTVAAPTIETVPAGRAVTGYGTESAQWRPFPEDHELSLASYAKVVAERLDFAVIVTGIEKPGDDLSSKPGVVLIDPWFVAAERGARTLSAFLENLPPWVLPVVVDAPGDDQTSGFAGRVKDILEAAGVPRGELSRRSLRGIESFQEFVSLMPFLITEAGRQYLRNKPLPHPPTTKPGPRPRLGGDPRAVPGKDSDA